jgi:YidC/Oxa1 family membrane protein insertase
MQVQRTILWVVFSMSLLFLWDGWQKYNGKQSMFGGPATTQSDGKPQGAPGAPVDASIPSAPSAASVPAQAAPATVPSGAAPVASQAPLVKVRNDQLALDVDPVGGQVRRAELLDHPRVLESGQTAKDANVVLLEDDANRKYVAQSGLIGAPQGASFPTHRTLFTVADSPRELAAGAKTVTLVMTAESGGLKLVRTYTLERGSHVVDVRDEITNVSQSALKPALYMQLTRDASKPEGESRFYSTYTGPVVYTDERKFQKVPFEDIDKGKFDYPKSAPDGWVGIIQHYFVAAWIPSEKATREFYTNKIDANLYAVGIKQPLAELAPGASVRVDSRLLIAPQDQRMLESIAPGLDLTVDYGWLTVIAKPIF